MKSFRLLVISLFVVAASAAYAGACCGSSCDKGTSKDKDSKTSKEVKVEEKKG